MPRPSSGDGRGPEVKGPSDRDLPDPCPFVAADVLRWCAPARGLWVDVGSGAGGVGLELARVGGGVVLLVDPDKDALRRGIEGARRCGLGERIRAVVAQAEALPIRSDTAELVVSRGSIFFWRDAAAGLREAYRVLRVGGKAMIGGGLGTEYPEWARREFARRRLENERRRGAQSYTDFQRLRRPDTFRAWARAAGLGGFEVFGDEGPSPEAPFAGLGVWLRFTKGCADDR
jgi:SAM-dependent methyltransferase